MQNESNPTKEEINDFLRPDSVVLFWSHVRKDCWCYTATRSHAGHGHLKRHANGHYKHFQAHAYSWIIHFGEIPDGLCVLHKCDNPCCVNPEHLYLGTRRQNNEEASRKGRTAKGETHYAAKLSNDTVIEMRRLYSDGHTQKALAQKYGIGQGLVSRVVRRKSWEHVP